MPILAYTRNNSTSNPPHIPVLLQECVEGLAIASLSPGAIVIDGTFGAGGHSREMLKRNPHCIVYCVDQDPTVFRSEQFLELQKAFGQERVRPCEGNFRNLRAVTGLSDGEADAVLLDLGMSSMQVDSTRGFSFRPEFDGELDMRMSPQTSITAKEVINSYSEAHLASIFHKLGEELAARRVAQGIVSARQRQEITTTQQLSHIAAKYIRKSRINPATKIFQALRIYINDEINALADGITEAELILKPGGRAAVISYHSLEDKMTKNFFKYASGEEVHRATNPTPSFNMVHRRVIKPTKEEIERNIRSRSAKLR